MKFQPVFSLHVFQSYIHHMINMLFSVLLKMLKKNKKAHLFVNINFGFKFRYWLTHAIFDRFKINIFFLTQMKKQDFIFKYTKKRFIMSNGKVLS